MTRPTISHAERRLLHMLEDFIVEQFHAAAAGMSDDAILAMIQDKLAAKAGAVFLRRYPPLRGPN